MPRCAPALSTCVLHAAARRSRCASCLPRLPHHHWRVVCLRHRTVLCSLNSLHLRPVTTLSGAWLHAPSCEATADTASSLCDGVADRDGDHSRCCPCGGRPRQESQPPSCCRAARGLGVEIERPGLLPVRPTAHLPLFSTISDVSEYEQLTLPLRTPLKYQYILGRMFVIRVWQGADSCRIWFCIFPKPEAMAYPCSPRVCILLQKMKEWIGFRLRPTH